jgi:hypothetical protein
MTDVVVAIDVAVAKVEIEEVVDNNKVAEDKSMLL